MASTLQGAEDEAVVAWREAWEGIAPVLQHAETALVRA